MLGRAKLRGFGVVAAGGAAAQTGPAATPAAVAGLRACRTITAAEARLACFDKAAASLDQAIAQKELVVLDRQTVRRTRRSLFGLTLPSLNIFGGGEGAKDEPEFVAIDTKVRAARPAGYGKYEVDTEEGAVWRNVDLWPDAPRAGEALHISKGAMGSFWLKARSLPPVKGIRLR